MQPAFLFRLHTIRRIVIIIMYFNNIIMLSLAFRSPWLFRPVLQNTKPGHDEHFALALTAKSGSHRCSVLRLLRCTAPCIYYAQM